MLHLLPLSNSNSYPFLHGISFRNRSSPNASVKSSKKLSIKCRRSEFFQQQNFVRPSDSSVSPQSPAGRVYVGHSIYKGKAALTIEPKAPEFVPLDESGERYQKVHASFAYCWPAMEYLLSGAIKLSKEGFVLLQFAPAVGTRQYDWNRKQVFSLSVTEIGTLMTLGAKDSCEFFHDPFKGKSEEGKIRKLLKVEPLPDGSGHFFNLSVQNRLMNVDESIYIPVTKAEFAVLISAFNFIIPYLLGWHAYANSVKPDDPSRSNNASPRSGADFEWGR